jgi:rubrerythrin
MVSTLEEAIVSSIKIENRRVKSYLAAMSKVHDNTIRLVFYQLAIEELDHFVLLCNMSQRNENELNDILKESDLYDHSYYGTKLNSINDHISETEALQIALNEEQACIDWYSEFVDSIRNSQIRDVFNRILKETHQHREMISEEYMRHMNMAHLTDHEIYV